MYATNGSNFNIDPDFKFNKYMKDKYENTEKFMNEKQETNTDSNESIPYNIIEEFQQRFLVLAEEINLLKDTVLKLQSYTMDVNRTLLEERINVLSDLGNDGERFLLNQDTIKIIDNVENLNADNEYIKEE